MGLLLLAILIISTWDPIFNSCGTSVITLATLFAQRASAIILKFLNSVEFERVDVVLLYWYATSASVRPIVLLDSWIINPSMGGLAVTGESDGITYLNLYRESSRFLLSTFLVINVLAVAFPSPDVPRFWITG